MSEPTRRDGADAREELRRLRRSERWLLVQAVIAAAVVAAIVWVRAAFFA